MRKNYIKWCSIGQRLIDKRFKMIANAYDLKIYKRVDQEFNTIYRLQTLTKKQMQQYIDFLDLDKNKEYNRLISIEKKVIRHINKLKRFL